MPSVVSLKTYIKPSRHPAFTRFNVFLRDRFTCQYCGERDELTFDHVVPRSKGGLTTWENVVAACSPCNLRKGDKLCREADMHPLLAPYAPTINDLHRNGRSFPPNYLHDSWDGLSLLGFRAGAVRDPSPQRSRAASNRSATRPKGARTVLVRFHLLWMKTPLLWLNARKPSSP